MQLSLIPAIVEEVSQVATTRKQLTINIYKTNFATESVAIALTEEINLDDVFPSPNPEIVKAIASVDMVKLTYAIAKKFNGAKVTDVWIDDEYGCVTATVNGVTYVDCGWLEGYAEIAIATTDTTDNAIASDSAEELDEDDRARIDFNNAVEPIGFDHQGEFYPIEFPEEEYEWIEIGRCFIITSKTYTAILNYSLMEYWDVHQNTIETLEMAIATVSGLEGVVNTEPTTQPTAIAPDNVVSLDKARNIKISKKYESESAEKVAKQTAQSGKFEIGEVYTVRSIGDGDIVFEYKVLARTKSFMTLQAHGKAIGKKKIFMYEGRECCKPQGDYSMCPILRS